MAGRRRRDRQLARPWLVSPAQRATVAQLNRQSDDVEVYAHHQSLTGHTLFIRARQLRTGRELHGALDLDGRLVKPPGKPDGWY